jgi:hypothetical protein
VKRLPAAVTQRELGSELDYFLLGSLPLNHPWRNEMRFIRSILVAVVALAPVAMAVAEENPSNQSCPVDTTVDKSTGKPRSGVQVCGGGGSGSVGVSASGDEIKHFLEYPIGQSDKSVAKQIGKEVHHFFSHLF